MLTHLTTRRSSVSLGPRYRRLFGASVVSNLGDGIGLVAYPWLASAVTRSPLLLSLILVAQRLPWLLFTLPAGVLADRYDRLRLMVGANLARSVITAVVALFVLSAQGSLPGPDEVVPGSTGGPGLATDLDLYLVLVVATLVLGCGEVVYDNATQTFLPRIVDRDQLERANGRLWSAEMVANSYLGPPLGAALLVVAFALPFAVDAATFGLSAALLAAIGLRRSKPDRPEPAPSAPASSIAGEPAAAARSNGWRAEAAEGFRWLWNHSLLRALAIILGLLNLLGAMAMAVQVFFAQEVLETSPTDYALLTIGAAAGGLIGGWTASFVSDRLGPGPSLLATLVVGGLASIGVGLVDSWPTAAVLMAVYLYLAVLWNVITVSLRQTIIPDEILGRVNSVYRFFGWGMIPIGAFLGGALVAAVEPLSGREWALRLTWIVGGIGQILLAPVAGRLLTTARIDAARLRAETG